MNIDLNYFPGWVRKSITFTIDDGNTVLDRKFMNYVKPAGITGTFNLKTPLKSELGADGYRELYRGYEIANHCRYHAYAFADGVEYKFADTLFDRETADPALVYPTEEEGIYRIRTYSWCWIADSKRYIECVKSAQAELEEVFGKGKIKGYVWPCGEQKSSETFAELKKLGFQSIRKTGNKKDSENFDLPADRTVWSYTANYTCMTETAAEFDALPDDGKLKWYCFGVHSHDFENAGRWDVLEDFCEKYGNRPEDFWYATVGEIMDYEDAVKSVKIEDGSIYNPSEVDLAIKVDGKRYTLCGGERLTF